MLAPVLAALLIGQAAGRGDLPALAARYVQLGLPVPPRKARLRYWTDVGCEWDDNQRSRANILAGFVVGPGAGTRVWLGTVYFDADHQTGGRLDVSWFLHNQKTGMPAAQNLRTVGFVSWAYWEDVNMATAIQLWLRGEKARARSLFSVPLAQSGQQQVVADLGRPGQLRCTAIGGLAAAHWLDRLSQPGPHLSEVRTGLATAGRLGEIDDSPILRRVVQGLAEPPWDLVPAASDRTLRKSASGPTVPTRGRSSTHSEPRRSKGPRREGCR